MLTIKINGPQFGASSLLKMTDLLKVTGLVVAVLSSCGLSMLAHGAGEAAVVGRHSPALHLFVRRFH